MPGCSEATFPATATRRMDSVLEKMLVVSPVAETAAGNFASAPKESVRCVAVFPVLFVPHQAARLAVEYPAEHSTASVGGRIGFAEQLQTRVGTASCCDFLQLDSPVKTRLGAAGIADLC